MVGRLLRRAQPVEFAQQAAFERLRIRRRLPCHRGTQLRDQLPDVPVAKDAVLGRRLKGQQAPRTAVGIQLVQCL